LPAVELGVAVLSMNTSPLTTVSVSTSPLEGNILTEIADTELVPSESEVAYVVTIAVPLTVDEPFMSVFDDTIGDETTEVVPLDVPLAVNLITTSDELVVVPLDAPEILCVILATELTFDSPSDSTVALNIMLVVESTFAMPSTVAVGYVANKGVTLMLVEPFTVPLAVCALSSPDTSALPVDVPVANCSTIPVDDTDEVESTLAIIPCWYTNVAFVLVLPAALAVACRIVIAEASVVDEPLALPDTP
jgi:hypothetical protein